MYLAKVIGNVVATQKSPELQGLKLLFIQPYVNQDKKLVASGSSIVAADSVGAGVGECVLYTYGSAARLALGAKAPVDAVIVGIVDAVEVEGTTVRRP
jgi:ethanolamine utilization protein EutN